MRFPQYDTLRTSVKNIKNSPTEKGCQYLYSCTSDAHLPQDVRVEHCGNLTRHSAQQLARVKGACSKKLIAATDKRERLTRIQNYTVYKTVLRIRIRDPVPFWPLDPGSGMNKPWSYFRELRNNFWIKIHKFFDSDPGSGMEKIRIRDKYPGSATLL